MGITFREKIFPDFSLIINVCEESPEKGLLVVLPPITSDLPHTSQEKYKFSFVDFLTDRVIGSKCCLTLCDLVIALGKFHGLDQLGIGEGGHRGGAVDRVAGGHSSYATGLWVLVRRKQPKC